MKTMRNAWLCGLGALALLATLAAVQVGSASATALCAAEESPCDPLEAYPSGTALKGSATNAELKSSLFDIKCSESTIAGETTAGEGTPLPGKVTELHFSNCAAESTPCSITTIHTPYAANTELTSGFNGETKLESSGSGTPGASATCSGITCTYVGKPGLTLTAGSSPTLAVSAAKLEREGGLLCPTSATWTATYTLSEPAPLFVTAQQKVAPTALCQSAPENIGGVLKCKKGDGYKGEVTGTAWNSPVKLEAQNNTGAHYADIECTTAGLVGKFENTGFSVATEGITSLTLDNGPKTPCTSTLKGNPNVTVTWKNFNWDESHFSYRQATEPQGRLFFAKNKGDPRLELTFGAEQCEYGKRDKTIEGFVWNPEKGTGMTVLMSTQWATIKATAQCPFVLVSGMFLELKRPGGDVFLAKEQQ